MPLTSLAARLSTLPRILAGPMLRRTEPGGVTVFVALREKRKVTMRVYTSADAGGKGQGKVAEGTRSTVPLGKNLHVVAVTAKPPAGQELKWGTLYVYNLFFGTHGNDATSVAVNGADLFSPGLLVADGAGESAARELLLYRSQGAPTLPSFPLPPVKLNELRIVHGSCRKAHGPGRDMLPAFDPLIAESIGNPTARPHQLFLTGDQIYADDVATVLLPLLTDCGIALLGWTPKLPKFSGAAGLTVGRVGEAATDPSLTPGNRKRFVKKTVGFSSGHSTSHLLSLGEFYAQYLFAWSDVLWPAELPEWRDAQPVEYEEWKYDVDSFSRPDGPELVWPRHRKARSTAEEERELLESFREGLATVRRVLAHLPSYMMFDDHEVTDDWYITEAWCDAAVRGSLGRHVVQNGLIAFGVFQAWGNTPETFETGTGKTFLENVAKLDANPDSSSRLVLTPIVGPPDYGAIAREHKLVRGPGALDWHYSVRGANYEVIVLDTRTWRSYPNGPEGSPALISEQGFKKQVPLKGDADYWEPPGADGGVTFLVAPAPFVGVDFIEWIQEEAPFISLGAVGAPTVDAEAWSFSRLAFERLLQRAFRRRPRVVVLSGDVHYGFSAHLGYWARQPFDESMAATLNKGALAQLTASALRNQAPDALHRIGYLRFKRMPSPQQWAGWNTVPTIYGVWPFSGDSLFDGAYSPVGNPPIEQVNDRTRVSVQPHWRYRISFVLAEMNPNPDFVITSPSSWERQPAHGAYHRALGAYIDYMQRHGAGKELVAKNNFGEVRLHWGSGDDKSVTHRLWWRLGDDLKPVPHTEYRLPLKVNVPGPPDLPIGP